MVVLLFSILVFWLKDVVETPTWTVIDQQNKYEKHWPADLAAPSFQPNQ